MALGVLIWAVPMIAMSGGLTAYIDVMEWWQGQHMEESASPGGMAVNVTRLSMYVIYTLGPGLIPLFVVAVRGLPNIASSLRQDWRAQTLTAWILPGAGYFTIIHLRQPGHTFTILPALLILTGLAIVACARHKARFRRNVWVGVMAVVTLINALFFLAGPTYLFGDTRMLFTAPTRSAIRDYDMYVTERLGAIRDTFDPQATTVIASGRNFRLPDYYLSDYQLPSLSHQIDTGPVALSDQINTLVLFDDSTPLELPESITVQSAPLPGGDLLHYITWSDTQIVQVGLDGLEIRDK
jgi:hypothetical protein